MVRVLRCFDLLEAHILVARLRYEGIDARVFDADFVRQDWFKMLVYGGFRIVVPEESATAARQILQSYRNGELTLPDEDGGTPCPNCFSADAQDDPQPRRNVFIAIIALQLVEALMFVYMNPSDVEIFSMFALQVAAYLILPWFLIGYFTWRMLCPTCGYRWRETRQRSHTDLASSVDAAERKTA